MSKKVWIICYVLSGLFLFLTANHVAADVTFNGVKMQGTTIKGFICGASSVNDADGNVYRTVQIGSQCWMATNLNVGTMLAGPATYPSDDGAVEKWCNGADGNGHTTSDEEACDGTSGNPKYGGLYTWDEAVGCPAAGCDGAGDAAAEGAQGICPSGWHIPTDAEFKTLEGTVDTTYGVGDAEWDVTGYRGDDAGTQLKEGGTSGFEALLAGNRNTDGTFYDRSVNTFYWSSSVSGANAWRRLLHSGNATVDRNTGNQANGLNVRCLKD